jgi:II/X family phage/plasmid replication protein
MMVDFLTVNLPDPFGRMIHGGEVVKVDPDGAIEWATRCKLALEGSHSNKMMVRNLMAEETIIPGTRRKSGLELSGNPAKFLHGHNLFGSADAPHLLEQCVAKVGSSLFPDLAPDLAGIDGQLSRIDLTASWLLDREADVMPFLKAMEESVWCPYRGRGVQSDHPGTLYYGKVDKGKRAKAWQLKIYHKGRDIGVHKLPEAALVVPGLLDEVNRTVRVELTLRSAELKRLGKRRVSDWTPAECARVWALYVGKLDFSEAKMNLDTVDLAGLVKPRLLDAITSWKAGNDLRKGRAPASFYRLRKEIREAVGIDIAVAVPKSNVVPLRRVIEAKPAPRPQWADCLAMALQHAA